MITSGVFNDIPSAIRTPGVFIEFDSRLANSGVWQTRLLVIGQRLESGEKSALSADRVTSGEQADRYYGRGSMLAEMLRAALAIDPYMETIGLALDDLVAGTVASGSIGVAVTGTRPSSLIASTRAWAIVSALSLASTPARTR